MFLDFLLLVTISWMFFFISKEKRDAEKSNNGKCHVEYNKTATGTSDMMDGLAVVTNDDMHRCVSVNTVFKKIRNIS